MILPDAEPTEAGGLAIYDNFKALIDAIYRLGRIGAVTTAGTITVDTADYSVADITANGNVTLGTFQNSVNGYKLLLRIKNNTGGVITVTPNSEVRFGSGITSLSNIPSGKIGYIGLVYTESKWDVLLNEVGY
jgi:hypothetical protein